VCCHATHGLNRFKVYGDYVKTCAPFCWHLSGVCVHVCVCVCVIAIPVFIYCVTSSL